MAPSSPLPTNNSDTEHRLREAEEHLRDAIYELQRRANPHAHHHHVNSPPCDHGPDESSIAHAIGNLCQTFLLSDGVKVGIGILHRTFKLVRTPLPLILSFDRNKQKITEAHSRVLKESDENPQMGSALNFRMETKESVKAHHG